MILVWFGLVCLFLANRWRGWKLFHCVCVCVFVFFNQMSVLNKSADIGFSWDLFSPISFRNARYTTSPLFSEVLPQGNCGTNKTKGSKPGCFWFFKRSKGPIEAIRSPGKPTHDPESTNWRFWSGGLIDNCYKKRLKK